MKYSHQPNPVFRCFEISISDKKMAKVMYAILKTRTKLVNSFSHSISKCTRQQSGGFIVDVIIEIDEDNIDVFEELAEVKLKTNEEFQGIIKVS